MHTRCSQQPHANIRASEFLWREQAVHKVFWELRLRHSKKQLDNFVKENHHKFLLNPLTLGSWNSKSLKPLEKCCKSSSIIGVLSACHHLKQQGESWKEVAESKPQLVKPLSGPLLPFLCFSVLWTRSITLLFLFFMFFADICCTKKSNYWHIFMVEIPFYKTFKTILWVTMVFKLIVSIPALPWEFVITKSINRLKKQLHIMMDNRPING